jgi:hypothetical protein
VLTGFRQRLIEHGLEEKVPDLLLARCSRLGLVKPRRRQRTDSTHVLATVRSANRLDFLAETLHATLEALAVAAPDWLTSRIDPDWARRYGARMDSYRLPHVRAERAPRRSPGSVAAATSGCPMSTRTSHSPSNSPGAARICCARCCRRSSSR